VDALSKIGILVINLVPRLSIPLTGAANQTRCFAHIINLVVKSILHQFDVPKAKANKALDEASKVLLHIAEDIETEETETQVSSGDESE